MIVKIAGLAKKKKQVQLQIVTPIVWKSQEEISHCLSLKKMKPLGNCNIQPNAMSPKLPFERSVELEVERETSTREGPG